MCGKENDRIGLTICSKCADKKRKRQIKKVLNNICTNCGKPNDRRGFTTCSKCADKKLKKYNSRREQGKCVDCGADVSPGNCRCEKCRSINREAQRKNRLHMQSIGICTRCGMRTAVAGKKSCEICLANDAEKKAVLYEKVDKDELRRKHREYMRMKRLKAKENAMCVECLKKPALPGRAVCIECSIKNKKRLAKKRQEKGCVPYWLAIECGICANCRKEKATHGKLCDACYDKAMANLEKANAVNDRSNHYWVQDNRIAFMARGSK